MTLQLTSMQKQRRDRKSQAKPCQLDMFAPPAPAPTPVPQSARAAAITAEKTMQTQAKRVLAEKAEKVGKAKTKVAKPKVRRCKP